MTISALKLRTDLLEPGMEYYLRAKLPDLSQPELDARIEETLRFLYLSSECVGDIPVTREIDDVWHLLILQTAEYERLCRRLPGGTFIHHCSKQFLAYFGESGSPEDGLRNEVRMLALYVRNFGPFDRARVRYWRLAASLVQEMGWTTDDLNDWLTRSLTQTEEGRRTAADAEVVPDHVVLIQ
jgi:hypothetical protein